MMGVRMPVLAIKSGREIGGYMTGKTSKCGQGNACLKQSSRFLIFDYRLWISGVK
jgi:hypothetical protein